MCRKCEIHIHCGAFVGREMNIMGDFWQDLARLHILKKDRTQCSSLSIPGMSKRFFYSPKRAYKLYVPASLLFGDYWGNFCDRIAELLQLHPLLPIASLGTTLPFNLFHYKT